ncbi:MAG: tRNA (adenosine(37)-N6)-threonylcarbamoyltransferase complex dimerization subunit type 1 TsaB [Dehalococcoidales bacterium]|nr:tRNA (adenosine(37)-N6)-threonylcarbamoyltransferase complex dimerization subunit type 1 TsaB [Dehalococcoidales bacterium]
MKVLGIDTSGYVNAVGIVENNRVLAEGRYPAKTDSLEQIVDNIDATLKKAGLTLDDIEGIGVGIGPGSWTGIRVGVTVGKTLAYSTGKPVSGVSSLDALGYVGRDQDRLVLSVISVGAGGAVYAARYRPEEGTITRVGEYYSGGVQELTPLLTEPVVLLAQDAQAYADMIHEYTDVEVTAIEARPYGSTVACLAEIRLEKGQADDVLALTPLYLKESTARVFVNKYAGRKTAEEK